MIDPLTIALIVRPGELLRELRASMYDLPVRILLEQSEVRDWTAFLAKLDQDPVDLLIMELALLNDPLGDAMRQIKATAGSPAVIILHNSPDSEAILRCVRAGADEFLYPPF